MSSHYVKQEWYNGEIIAEELLNHMEAGISDAHDRIDDTDARGATDKEIDDLLDEIFGGT